MVSWGPRPERWVLRVPSGSVTPTTGPWGYDISCVRGHCMAFIHTTPRFGALGQGPLARSPEVPVAHPLLLPQPCWSGWVWGDPRPLPHPWAHTGGSAHPPTAEARGPECCCFRLSPGAGHRAPRRHHHCSLLAPGVGPVSGLVACVGDARTKVARTCGCIRHRVFPLVPRGGRYVCTGEVVLTPGRVILHTQHDLVLGDLSPCCCGRL